MSVAGTNSEELRANPSSDLGTVTVEGLGMLGSHPCNLRVAGDMCDQHGLVVQEVLSQSCIGPSIDQVLVGGVFGPVIWKRDQQSLLYMFRQIAPSLDFSIPVVECSCLREVS